MESPTQMIKIEQSQSDRSKIPYHPVRFVCLSVLVPLTSTFENRVTTNLLAIDFLNAVNGRSTAVTEDAWRETRVFLLCLLQQRYSAILISEIFVDLGKSPDFQSLKTLFLTFAFNPRHFFSTKSMKIKNK